MGHYVVIKPFFQIYIVTLGQQLLLLLLLPDLLLLLPLLLLQQLLLAQLLRLPLLFPLLLRSKRPQQSLVLRQQCRSQLRRPLLLHAVLQGVASKGCLLGQLGGLRVLRARQVNDVSIICRASACCW